MEIQELDPDGDLVYKNCARARVSERKVTDKIYESLADLKGQGFSISEASQALVKVNNSLFNRKCKLLEENEQSFDFDTLPNPRNLRHVNELIESCLDSIENTICV
ncbi:unnamed protein product [Lepeophtheirus salmonis]|uniref:(salmon louse) hypothetical protein n=1 Tax=Lepeophtheirus salmonis TaxID=72036 RepID=A0A7R8D2D8_LEPSM|nr:unnamed protein product [Lepeophtheirus salmonis]CAF3004337.1 unnamed protein product [Lepeophtheirus salmonis]